MVIMDFNTYYVSCRIKAWIKAYLFILALQLLKNMTGFPKDDVCPKERITKLNEKISQEGILALTHRAMKLNCQKLEEEKRLLDKKVDEEIYILEQKFPLLYDVTGSTSIHVGSQELLPSQIIKSFNKKK